MRNILIPFVMFGVLTGCNSLTNQSYCLVEVERDGFDHMTVDNPDKCAKLTDDNEIYYDTPGKFKIGDVVYSVTDVETQRHNPIKVVPVPITTTSPKFTTTTTTPPKTITTTTTTTIDDAARVKVKKRR